MRPVPSSSIEPGSGMGSAPSEAENENVSAWLALKTNIPGVGSKPVKWNAGAGIVKIFAAERAGSHEVE
jgi:hypothetical protein